MVNISDQQEPTTNNNESDSNKAKPEQTYDTVIPEPIAG